MPEEIQRSVTGPRGAFPLRFPVGKSLAFVTVLALVPVWWEVGEAVRPRIKTFYAKTYWKSLADGWVTAPNGLPKMGVYPVLVIGNSNAPLLATQPTLDAVPEQVREQSLLLDSKAFHDGSKRKSMEGLSYPFITLLSGWNRAALCCCFRWARNRTGDAVTGRSKGLIAAALAS